MRNPKDMAVSYFRFQRSMVDDEYLGTFEEFIDLLIEGKSKFFYILFLKYLIF